jgi:hypothetical protein
MPLLIIPDLLPESSNDFIARIVGSPAQSAFAKPYDLLQEPCVPSQSPESKPMAPRKPSRRSSTGVLRSRRPSTLRQAILAKTPHPQPMDIPLTWHMNAAEPHPPAKGLDSSLIEMGPCMFWTCGIAGSRVRLIRSTSITHSGTHHAAFGKAVFERAFRPVC